MSLVSSSKEKIYNKEYHVKACQDFDRLVQINDGYRSAYHKRAWYAFSGRIIRLPWWTWIAFWN